MSSIYTGYTSILKNYTPGDREKAKAAIINKVRFQLPKQLGVLEAINAACNEENYQPLEKFVEYVRESVLDDEEFICIMNDARSMVQVLNMDFRQLVELLLALPWSQRTPKALQAYSEFFVDLMVAQHHYIYFGIYRLIAIWLPDEADASRWSSDKGTPNAELQEQLEFVHRLLDRMLTTIPLTFDVVLKAIDARFPYYKKSAHIIVGYVHNLLWLLEYKPVATEFVVQLLLQHLVRLDVNAPRNEIEEAEEDDEDEDEDDDELDAADADELATQTDVQPGEIFAMDDFNRETTEVPANMNHPIAQTLDKLMEKVFIYLQAKDPQAVNLSVKERQEREQHAMKFLKILLNAFDKVILPSHNTHHAQFVMFYYCSFKNALAEAFLSALWAHMKNPNVSAVIRQASVGYIASFLARAKFLPITIIRHYLQELCDWAHSYIQRSDSARSNGTLKANLVFFTVCQAIFYVIAFRSRDLTVDNKSLLFLQSLQLSALVTCHFNPLRVCLPAVATAFAGVTRTYQLAYCHTILERNARRKLATVYNNDVATPEETLDTFFPFDPYLLKMSARRITPIYLQYQASEAEEQAIVAANIAARSELQCGQVGRKRGDSEMLDDGDFDEFLLLDKRRRFAAELAQSQEREAQFTYGLSPGFHT